MTARLQWPPYTGRGVTEPSGASSDRSDRSDRRDRYPSDRYPSDRCPSDRFPARVGVRPTASSGAATGRPFPGTTIAVGHPGATIGQSDRAARSARHGLGRRT